MSKEARDYNSQGLKLVDEGRLEVAVNFFTKAIDEDPSFLDAYKNRGETLIKLNRKEEGEKDLKIAEGKKRQQTEPTHKIIKKSVEKYNLGEVEDLWGDLSGESGDDDDDLFLDDFLSDTNHAGDTLEAGGEQFGTEDLLYDDTYSAIAAEDEEVVERYEAQEQPEDLLYEDTFSEIALGEEQVDETYAEEIAPDETALEETIAEEHVAQETEEVETVPDVCSAMLEYVGGMRQEVAQARLFEPLDNSLLIIDEETDDEQVVFFDQLLSLRLSSLPARLADKRKESCTKEIIETVDGSLYNELVHPEQDLEGLLICFAAEKEAPYPISLISKSIIRKRTQDKPLTDILLEKRFISRVMLQRALQEYKRVKDMTLEKIVAKRAHVRLAEIEEAIKQAEQSHMQGLQKEEILLFSGLVNEQIILDAVERLEEFKKMKIGDFLIDRGMVKEREVYLSLAEKHKIPFLDLKGRKISKMSFACLPEKMVVDNEILPLAMKDDILLVATHFIEMDHMSETIAKAAGCEDVRFVLSPPGQIRKIISLLYT